MAKLWTSLLGKDEQRYNITDWAHDKFSFNGISYPITGMATSSNVEQVENSFVGYVQGAYKANGIVFACIEARRLVFSSARPMWQRFAEGQPADLWSNPDLELLRKPWPNGTSFELLSRMEQDISLAGNFYAVREGRRLRRLRPDWVEIILTAPPDAAVQSDVAGYLYHPGGSMSRTEPQAYGVNEVAHWSPIPDPEAQYRGMSWITPVVREIVSDKLATEHKAKFFTNAATPNLAVSFKESVTEEQFKKFMETMNAAHQGVNNAYKTLYLGGGADVTVVGADLKQLDFKATQGAGETRIAVNARVPAVVLGISEGLGGSSLNAGNYNVAKRSFANGFLHPQWESAFSSLSSLLKVPSDSRLWYDPRHIPFLRDDQTEVAEIQTKEATALRQLVDAGFDADAAIEYLRTSDLNRLRGSHSGLFSVQLQPPGTTSALADPPVADEDDEDE